MNREQRMQRHEWDCSLDPQTVPLFLALQWAQQRSLAGMRPLLARHQLSLAAFDVLATLRNAPAPHELTPGQIREQLLITSGGLTGVMGQLEQRALVERRQDVQDRRVRPIRLSAAGRQLIEDMMVEAVAGTGQWLRSRLNSADLETLTRLLQRLDGLPD